MTDALVLRLLYERAVNLHAEELFHYALRVCGRYDAAEDLVQETFLHAWRSIDALRDESRLRPWLFQILRRRHFRMLRTNSKVPSVAIEQAGGVADRTRPHDMVDLRDTLQAGLGQLDERFKQPFLMVYLEGLSCEAAARELKIPLGTLLSRIFRARQSLRATMTLESVIPQPETLKGANNKMRTGGRL